MKLLIKSLYIISSTIIFFLIIYLPFYDTRNLYKSYISEKVFLFAAATGILFLLLVLIIVLNSKQFKSFKITWLDLSLFVFVSYLSLNRIFISEMDGFTLKYFQLISLCIFYIIIRNIPSKYYQYFIYSMLISGIIQAIYGNLQLYDIYPSKHHLFNITGSFFNPGPYSGYLSIIFPIAFVLYLKNRKIPAIFQVHAILHKHRSLIPRSIKFKSFATFSSMLKNNLKQYETTLKQPETRTKIKLYFQKYLSLVAIIAILLVIPATRSRASWLAIIVSSAYIGFIEFSIQRKLLQYFRTKTRKSLAGVGITILIGALSSGIYYFKKDSADGRLLIWKVSSGMIKDKPLFGHGFEKFQAGFMHYQARYFEEDPDNIKSYVADDIIYPFNEYVKLLVESGLTGFVLLSLIIFLVFYPARRHKYDVYFLAIRGGILGISVFSFFSYPTEILPVLVSLVLLLAILAKKFKPISLKIISYKRNHTRILPILGISLTWIIFALIAIIYLQSKKLYKAYFSWDEGYKIYRMGAYQECLKSFDESYEMLKNNGEYLIMYGKALSMAGDYNKAIEVLQRAEKYQKNTILYTALGDSYRQEQKNEDASKAYLKAFYMIPSRFYPKYLLVKLYDETGQDEKAIATATEIMNKKEKIPSTAIEEIKGEIKVILEKHNEKQK